jgi:hypothetical protein
MRLGLSCRNSGIRSCKADTVVSPSNHGLDMRPVLRQAQDQGEFAALFPRFGDAQFREDNGEI